MSPRNRPHRVQAGLETREMPLENLGEAEQRVEAVAARLQTVEGFRAMSEAVRGAEGMVAAILIDQEATDICWARRPTNPTF
jgi:hypothetical protein